MRLSLLLTIVGLLNLNAAGLSQMFTISGKNISVNDVIDNVEKKSGYKFLYQNELIENAQKVDMEVFNQPIGEVLRQALSQSNLGYRMFNDKLIVLTRAGAELVQVVTITGKVTASISGEPVPGATVMVKGTTTGTSTNESGVYTLEISNPNSTLVISSVGYLSEEIQTSGRSVVDVQLAEDIQKMDEIVVIGYGTQKKSDLTGSISSVRSETLKNLPVKSLSEALQGKVAGVYVTKGTGEPGAKSGIIIRGAASINGLKPLYIVDGVRMGTGNNFNMSDVENIEILKDASSAAIYGVEAAGGVILVTTKKGRQVKKCMLISVHITVQEVQLTFQPFWEARIISRPGKFWELNIIHGTAILQIPTG